MSDDKKRLKKSLETDAVEDKLIDEIEQDVDEYLYSETKKKVGVKQKPRKPKKQSVQTVSSVDARAESKTSQTDDSQKSRSAGQKRKVKKSLRVRASLLAAKIVFLYIPLALVTLVFTVLIALKIILQPSFVENLAETNFNRLAAGSLSLEVRKFNPYRGFVIENIIIKDSPEFGGGECVHIEKFVFDYQFFSVFTGNLRLNEIGIYKPKVAVKQRNGVLNFSKLMKPSVPKEKKAEDTEEEDKKTDSDDAKIAADKEKEALTEIRLPIKVSFFFKFILDGLSVSFIGDDMKAHLNDFSMSALIDIPPFKRVPLSPEAVKIIKLVDIKINPNERLDAGLLMDTVSVAPPLLLSFNLFYSGEDSNNTRFYSNFKAGTSGTAIRFNDTQLDPLTVSADYKLYYNPVTDYFNIESFGVSFAGDRLLNISGSIDKVITEQNLNVAITESLINLNKVYPYVRTITKNDSMVFGGAVSLAPLSVTGNLKNILADGRISMNEVNFSMPGFATSVPDFGLDYKVNYKEEGVLAETGITASGLTYTLGRDRSGRNNLSLALNASSTEKFTHHRLNSFDFRLNDPVSRLDALSLAMRADVRTGEIIKANLNIDQLVFRNQPLQNMTPSALSEQLKGVPLKKPVTLDLQTDVEVVGPRQNVVLDLGLKVPDYGVNDMHLSTALRHDLESKRADIERFRISSASYGLNFTIAGFADYSEAPLKDSDLRVSLAVQQNRLKDMYGGWNIKGLASLNARMRGNTKNGSVAGNIFIKDLDVENINTETPDVKVLAINKMNLDFPYEYKFMTEYTGLSKIEQDKSKLIANDNFKAKKNFRIESVKIGHPARPKQYMDVVNGLDGTMHFKNNSFDIVNLQAAVLGGSLTMKDTLFYLADLDTNNMEFNLGLDVVNMNMGRLDKADSTATDAFLSLTSSVSGKGLDFKKRMNVTGNINIYKVGEKVAGRLMKGLEDEKGRSKIGTTQTIVDNTMSIRGFDFYMDGGNVYTTVQLDPRHVARASGIRIANNQIKYDRIPIQEFMRSVQEE